MPQIVSNSPGLQQNLLPSTLAMITNIASALVDHPSRVAVTAASAAQVITLILTVDVNDYGKVIGKQGRTARSLRTVLYAISQRTGQHFQLNIRSHPQA